MADKIALLSPGGTRATTKQGWRVGLSSRRGLVGEHTFSACYIVPARVCFCFLMKALLKKEGFGRERLFVSLALS